MQLIFLGSSLTYDVNTPTVLLLNVAIAATDHQAIVTEALTITPHVKAAPFAVGLERNRFHRLLLQPGQVSIDYTARARLMPATEHPRTIDQIDYALLPPEVLTYLNPSRYCESDKLASFALAEFGDMQQNFDRVTTICDWIAEYLTYQSGTTTSQTTACDVLDQRTGVCRDFAHLAIGFCRALGIPARYVSGYACRLDEQDFHGFFEAYLDGNWYLFDPTRLAPTGGLVRIGVGRDAADTAFATLWGDAKLATMKIWVEDYADTDNLLDQHHATVAVSTA